MTTTNTRIYIANLGKYNEGELVGEWVNLPIEEEELEEVYIRIKVAHRDEDGEFIPYYMENGIIYEETAIHDWESEFDELHIGEWDNVLKLSEKVEELEALDPWEINATYSLMEAYGYSLEEALGRLDSCTFWNDYTMEDLAYELVEECYFDKNTPDFIRNYFDYAAFAHDLEFDGYTETKYGVILDC